MSNPSQSSNGRRGDWLFGLDAGSRPRRVEHDDTGGIFSLSGVDSTGVTRFRRYVFNQEGEAMAASAMTELLDEVDPVR